MRDVFALHIYLTSLTFDSSEKSSNNTHLNKAVKIKMENYTKAPSSDLPHTRCLVNIHSKCIHMHALPVVTACYCERIHLTQNITPKIQVAEDKHLCVFALILQILVESA